MPGMFLDPCLCLLGREPLGRGIKAERTKVPLLSLGTWNDSMMATSEGLKEETEDARNWKSEADLGNEDEQYMKVVKRKKSFPTPQPTTRGS